MLRSRVYLLTYAVAGQRQPHQGLYAERAERGFDPVRMPAQDAMRPAGQFADWLGERCDRTFADYCELQRWSVENLELFWAAVWEWFNLGSPTPQRVLGSRAMPGAEARSLGHCTVNELEP